MPVAKYNDVFAKMCMSFEREESEMLARAAPCERLSFITDPESAALAQNTGLPSGRERLADLQRALDGFGFKRSKNQRWRAARGLRL